jgi:hypothetical protein
MRINAEFVVGAVRGYINRQGENPNEYTARRAWAVLADMAYSQPELAASKWYATHSASGAGFVTEWNKVQKTLKRGY